MKNLSPKELKNKIEAQEALFLLDIRENYERELDCIPSTHIPMAHIAEEAVNFPKDNEIVVICRSGRRAIPVADMLENDFYFSNVSILEGGLLAWKDEVDPNLALD